MPDNTRQVEQQNQQDPWAWSLWKHHSEWKNSLDKKLAHKSLGIPEDDVINVDNSRRGIDWKALAVIGATALGGYALWQNQQQGTGPDDSEYEVRFYDAEGQPINTIQPLPEK